MRKMGKTERRWGGEKVMQVCDEGKVEGEKVVMSRKLGKRK